MMQSLHIDSIGPMAFAGTVTVAVSSHDRGALAWLSEYVEPWFTSTQRAADWQLHLSAAPRPWSRFDTGEFGALDDRACFRLDSGVVSLPAAERAGGLRVADRERSCFFDLVPGRVDLVGAADSRRWRFGAVLILLGIIAARMRRTALDLHAAALDRGGRGILVAGPKGAGKTTLATYLLAAGGCSLVANDRVFVVGPASAPVVHGAPTPVKIRAGTLREFPALLKDFPPLERPYLFRREEYASARRASGDWRRRELAMSPSQFLGQLGAEARASTTVALVVLPQVQDDHPGWSLIRLSDDELRSALGANRYGAYSDRREATIFEELEDGSAADSAALVESMMQCGRGFRLVLGRGAFASRALAERLFALADDVGAP